MSEAWLSRDQAVVIVILCFLALMTLRSLVKEWNKRKGGR